MSVGADGDEPPSVGTDSNIPLKTGFDGAAPGSSVARNSAAGFDDDAPRSTVDGDASGSSADGAAPRSTGTFRSLAIPNYRKFFVGALVSNIGTWMESVAQGWLVLTILTDNSAMSLGIVSALRFLGVPLLAPIAGALADRFPKRRILLATQTLLGLNSALLCTLVVTGNVQLWMVYCLATFEGCINAFDNPSRQAFVSEMVPENNLQNAVGLNATSFNSARLIGPAVAGLLISWLGVGPVFGINAISYLSMLIALSSMKPELLRTSPPRAMKGSFPEALSYLRTRPDIMLIMLLVFMLSTFGMNFNITNATMATQTFGKAAAEYGLLGSMIAIGTLAGALSAAHAQRPRLRVLLIGTLAFAFFAGLASIAESYLMYAMLLVPTGFFMLRVVNTANATVQLSTPAALRGRVMAVYTAIFVGGTPIGSPTIGWIQDHLGARWGVAVGAIVAGVTASGIIFYTIRSKNLHVKFEMWPLRLDVWNDDDEREAEAAAAAAALTQITAK